MPIGATVRFRQGSDEEFERMEYELVGACYDVHNEQGRLCDERIYRDLIASLCQQRGLGRVLTEVPLLVAHESFQKRYFLDLLIDGFFVVELKTVDDLSGEHRNQIINYRLLTGLQHGKLINMRSTSVDG
jgi:GxxExxY protein